MSLFQKRDNTILLPLSASDGTYIDPAAITDAVYSIFSKCYTCKLFEASLSAGSITIVQSGVDDVLQVEIPGTVDIQGQVPNELKILKDGKWLGVTLSQSKINFIQTRF
jgi:hypothetical protein